MAGTTIAAIITASGAVVAGLLQFFKLRQKAVTSKASNISDSMIATGANINQSYSPTVHHHHAPAQNSDTFSSKVESTPTGMPDLLNQLDS